MANRVHHWSMFVEGFLVTAFWRLHHFSSIANNAQSMCCTPIANSWSCWLLASVRENLLKVLVMLLWTDEWNPPDLQRIASSRSSNYCHRYHSTQCHVHFHLHFFVTDNKLCIVFSAIQLFVQDNFSLEYCQIFWDSVEHDRTATQRYNQVHHHTRISLLSIYLCTSHACDFASPILKHDQRTHFDTL